MPRLIALLLAAVVPIWASSGCNEPAAVAQTDHGSHHEGAASAAQEGQGSTPSAAAAWAELVGVRNAIASALDGGRLGDIHPETEKLAPLARSLLERSADLGAEKRARLEGAVKQVPKLAGALHEAADAGNSDGTRRQLERLDALLELIRAQHPAGSLPAPGEVAPEEPAPHGSSHEGAEQMHGAGHHRAVRPLAEVDHSAAVKLQVRAREYGFEPRTIELRAGQPTRIELRNEGALEHALVVKTPDGTADWVHLHAAARGADSGTYQIDEPGRYPVLCTIAGHTEAGMVAELVVTGR
jgi:plastocyanin